MDINVCFNPFLFSFVVQRHRRFSIQSWVGGFTAKSSSNLVRSPPSPNNKVGSSRGKRRSHQRKAGGNFAMHDKDGIVNSTAVLNEDKKTVSFPEKHAVAQDTKCSKMSPSFVNSHSDKTSDNVVHKFKWGALEADDLVLHRQNSHGSEIKFDDIGDGISLASGNNEKRLDSVLCSSSTTSSSYYTSSSSSSSLSSKPQQISLLKKSANVGFNNNASTHKDKSTKETCEVVNYKLPNTMKKSCNKMHTDNLEGIKGDHLSSCHSSGEKPGSWIKLETPVAVLEVEEPRISEPPVTYGVSKAKFSVQNNELFTSEKSGHQISRESILTASVEDRGDLEDGKMHDELSESRTMSALGEVETAEKGGLELSRELIVRASSGKSENPQDGEVHDLNSQVMDALGVGETAESSERLATESSEEAVEEGSGWFQVKRVFFVA